MGRHNRRRCNRRIAARLQNNDPTHVSIRIIATYIGLADLCSHPRCRRHRRCLGPGAYCLLLDEELTSERMAILQRDILPTCNEVLQEILQVGLDEARRAGLLPPD